MAEPYASSAFNCTLAMAPAHQCREKRSDPHEIRMRQQPVWSPHKGQHKGNLKPHVRSGTDPVHYRSVCSVVDGKFVMSLSVAWPGATPKEVDMSILAWIVLGLIAGFIGSKIVNKTGEGFVLDIVLGIIGAVVGGYLFNMFGAAGVTGVNIYSLFVAVIGAVLVLVVYHAVRRPA
jgi:uncharacterized membrane protein YeaQ/YmgE (transglycosylase-associated protein family)